MQTCSVNHMRAPDWTRSYEMQKTGREITREEKAEIFDEIIRIILDSYNKQILPNYERYSRSAQAGHLILTMLFARKILSPGTDDQMRLKL